jgi:hypothetical protein
MTIDIDSLAQWLEASALGTWMRAGWGYPVANVLHLAGLVMLVGPILLLDLRLLGLWRNLPLPALSRLFTTSAIAGLLLLLVTGVMLFSADATTLVGNRLMQLKLVGVALAVVNALAFRLAFSRQLDQWTSHVPLPARISAALSLMLWPAVMVAGRMIAYV